MSIKAGQDMKVAVAVNWNHRGKIRNGSREIWRKFNGGFTNEILSTGELIGAIKSGHPYTTHHRSYRKSSEFIRGQVLALDFDTDDDRSSFDHLCRDEFINRQASFLHTTPSHTDDAPRSRVVFILEKPIYNPDQFTELASALVNKFEASDKRCKDCARFFFSSKGCDTHFLGNTLTTAVAKEALVLPYRDHLQEQEEKRQEILERGTIARAGDVDSSALDNLWDALLDHIAFAPHGQKYDTLLKISRTFGGYVASGYIERRTARNLLVSAISKRNIDSLAVAERAIDDALEYGQADPLYVKRHESNGTNLLALDTPTPQGLATQPIEEVVGQPNVNKMSKLMLQAEGAKVRYGQRG